MGAIPFPEQRLVPFHPVGIDAPAAAAPGGAVFSFQAETGRCVVAVTDGTSEGSNAVWRAAAVARDLGMPLRLLVPDVRVDELRYAQGLARRLAHQAVLRLGVQAHGDAITRDVRGALAEMAPQPALIVLPHRRGKVLSDWLLGTAAERIFRSAFMPLLVVKRPASTSYRRVLVATQQKGEAAILLGAAQSIKRDPRIGVMHLMDAPQAYSPRLGHAHAHMLEAARESRAQLVVIGKQRRTPLQEMLADGVSRRLVREGRADVLMLPVQGCEPGRAP